MTTQFPVVSPIGQHVGESGAIAPRLPDLKGKTVCEVSNMAFRADALFPILRDLLTERYPDIKFIPYTEIPDVEVWGNAEEKMQNLKEVLIKKGCDAVISGVGG